MHSQPADVIVFEDSGWTRLLPLVYFRTAAQLRCGLATLLDRVAVACRSARPQPPVLGTWCRPTLAGLTAERTRLPTNQPLTRAALLLNGRGAWSRLPADNEDRQSWVGTTTGSDAIACVGVSDELARELRPEIFLDEIRLRAVLSGLPRRDVSEYVQLIDWPWQLILGNESRLIEDWESWRSRCGGQPATAPPGVHLLNADDIFIGAGTQIKPAVVIDAQDGPVWIGQNVKVFPHCYVQGPACIGDGSLLQPGAVVHAGTTIGPRCKVGGEIEASIIHGFSNKQHDGFLGHSYVGSWVNIAADCINSDLKNTYGTIRVPINGREVDSGEMFVGMLVGDFSKAGINVSFPTGAVIGFCSSVFASRSPKFVPSFAWIDGEAIDRFDEQRGLAVARKVMARRDHQLTAYEERVFRTVRQQALAIELQPQMAIEFPLHSGT